MALKDKVAEAEVKTDEVLAKVQKSGKSVYIVLGVIGVIILAWLLG